MKANEAPEKVYLHLTTGNRLLNGKYCERKPAKIRVDDKIIEYTRTDAFIDKAVGRLKHYLDNSVWVANDVGVREKEVIIEDFKSYMKQKEARE